MVVMMLEHEPIIINKRKPVKQNQQPIIIKKPKRIEEIIILPHKSKQIALPDELIDGILLNLPVRSLIRFKCLSKQWHSVISSHRFGRECLHYNRNNPKTNSLIINGNRCDMFIKTARKLDSYRKKWGTKLSAPKISMVNYQSMESVREQNQIEVLSAKEVSFSFLPSNYDPFVITCCCDGIMSVTLSDRLCLWNPQTNESKTLPLPEPELTGAWEAFGFGYDSFVDDYKIIRVPSYWHVKQKVKNLNVHVMTLKSNLWRKIRTNFPYAVNQFGQAISSSADGNLYWFAKVTQMDNKIVLIGFDLVNEIFREVAMPILDQNENLTLGILGGCLSLTSYNKLTNCFDIWIIKAEETWIKFVEFPLNNFRYSIKTMRPLFSTPDGVLVMHASFGDNHEDAGLIYDPKAGTCKIFEVDGVPEYNWNDVYAHSESIVSFSKP